MADAPDFQPDSEAQAGLDINVLIESGEPQDAYNSTFRYNPERNSLEVAVHANATPQTIPWVFDTVGKIYAERGEKVKVIVDNTIGGRGLDFAKAEVDPDQMPLLATMCEMIVWLPDTMPMNVRMGAISAAQLSGARLHDKDKHMLQNYANLFVHVTMRGRLTISSGVDVTQALVVPGTAQYGTSSETLFDAGAQFLKIKSTEQGNTMDEVES